MHKLQERGFPDRSFRVRRLSFAYRRAKCKIAKCVRLLRGVIANRLGHLSRWSTDEADAEGILSALRSIKSPVSAAVSE
ncbi:hypothetical protein RHECNPAF_13300110 [Rhizobium etli CNPAF512]|nr:hypothetical protein RHECNPAF_13300110 [Rhizobium etli CNPAF512]